MLEAPQGVHMWRPEESVVRLVLAARRFGAWVKDATVSVKRNGLNPWLCLALLALRVADAYWEDP